MDRNKSWLILIVVVVLVLGLGSWYGKGMVVGSAISTTVSSTNPLQVTFNGGSNLNNPLRWDFGDGFETYTILEGDGNFYCQIELTQNNYEVASSVSECYNPTHTYAAPGTYHVTLTSESGANTETYDITIEDITIQIDSEHLILTALSTYSLEGQLVNYNWKIINTNDNSEDNCNNCQASSCNCNIPVCGSYKITLTINSLLMDDAYFFINSENALQFVDQQNNLPTSCVQEQPRQPIISQEQNALFPSDYQSYWPFEGGNAEDVTGCSSGVVSGSTGNHQVEGIVNHGLSFDGASKVNVPISRCSSGNFPVTDAEPYSAPTDRPVDSGGEAIFTTSFPPKISPYEVVASEKGSLPLVGKVSTGISAGSSNYFTFAGWINPSDSNTGVMAQTSFFKLYFENTLKWWIKGSFCTIDTGVSLPENSWTHVSLVYAAGEVIIYLDGEPLDIVILDAGCLLNYGETTESTITFSEGFFGSIDEYYFYNRDLARFEVNQLVEQGYANEPLDYISRWEFEGTVANDGVASDVAGRNHGMYKGSLTTEKINENVVDTARREQALRFSGSSEEYVVVSKTETDASGTAREVLPDSLQIPGSFTVSAWVKPESLSSEVAQVIASNRGWFLVVDSYGAISFSIKVEDNPAYSKIKKENFLLSSHNEWTQVVGVYDQYNLHLYINGEEVVSPEEVAGDIDFEGNPLFIGNSRVLDPETGDWFFPTPFLGSLDDIRIYGRALDDWEVKAMYYASKSCFNKYCPSWRTVEELPYFEETSSYVKKASEKLNSYLDGTTDIYEQQKPSFTRIILKDDHKDNILHFLHDERNYYLSVKQSNQWNVTAKVEAFNLAATTSTGTGGSLGTINYGAVTDLSTDKMHLLPKQTTLNLDSDSAPEGYLQSFGYFDQTKWLGMVVGVTPYMDFDQYAEWNVVLLHNQKQNLHLESSYSTPDRYYVTLSQLGEEYKLIVGEEGGSLTEYALTDEPFEHFFDELKTIGFKVQKQGTFQQGAVIKFTRIPAGLDEVYEKQFTETKPITLFNKVIKVCDNDPPIFAALTVCEGLVEIFDVLENVPKFLDEFSEVLFYYQKPVTDVLADKYGSAFHIFRFPEDQPVELALYFANNMFDGRRLALELDGDYYLLSKDTSKPSADLPYLNLARISGETHPSYLPVGDLGKVKFNLPLKKQINIELIPEPNLNYRIMKITSAIPEDINLVDNLQGYVETYSSVTYKDASGNSALGLVSLAGDDLSVFVNKMKVTYAGGKVELPWNKTFVMPNVQINDGYNGGEALFFYHDFTPGGTIADPQFTKYADVYLYYDLNKGDKKHKFTDVEFMLPILRGNSLVLGVDDHHYKLTTVDPWRGEMPTSGFNYEKLRLKSFDGKEVLPQVLGDVVIFELTEAEGKSIKVEFNTVNSEVTFSAVKSKAALAEVAKPINIVQSLQANLTSYRPLELVGSSFGSLAVHPLDISQLQEVMRVTSPSAEWEFIYNNPQEINFNGNAKLLVHYNQFTGTNGLYKKQADLYLLYDLNEGEKEHSFTKDDFITPLVEGKKLGLKLGNSYYWLSSTGVGFSYANLNLIGGRALTKEVKSATETSLAQVVFTTADGSKILLEFNSLERKVRFIVQQSGEIEKEFAPSRDYETMLPGYSVRAGIDNSLQIGSKQFYNCDSATTNEFVDSFFLCTNPGSEQRIFLNQPIIEAAGTDKILVWYKIKAATKEVSLHYLLGDLSTSFSVDWTSLVENLVKNNNPVVMLDGKYYLLATTGRTLDQFGLQEIGSLENFEKALVESREGRQEFRFAVHDKIISLKQELVGTSITLTFSSLPYLIVSREGFTQSNALFLSSLGSPVYRLSSMLEGELTKMVIQTEAGENIFVGRLPFGQSRRILLTNGESITLEVTGQGVRLRT